MSDWFLPASLTLLAAAPAAARGFAQIPEANSITLFALGVAGVIVGRRLSMNRSDKSDGSDTDD